MIAKITIDGILSLQRLAILVMQAGIRPALLGDRFLWRALLFRFRRLQVVMARAIQMEGRHQRGVFVIRKEPIRVRIGCRQGLLGKEFWSDLFIGFRRAVGRFVFRGLSPDVLYLAGDVVERVAFLLALATHFIRVVSVF